MPASLLQTPARVRLRKTDHHSANHSVSAPLSISNASHFHPLRARGLKPLTRSSHWPSIHGRSAPSEAPMDKVRFGVVGLGNMGGHHISYLNQIDGAVLTAVCDADKPRVEKHGKDGIGKFTNYN